MKLFFSPGACSLSPHIVMNEMGLKFETQRVDLRNKGDFATTNPKGQVPAILTDKGELLTEGAVIVQYVADQKPEAGLMPKWGTWERYRAMELLNYIATEIHKGMGPLWHVDRLYTGDAAVNVRKNTVETLGKKFDHLEGILKNQKFLMGDTFTAPDAYLFTVLNWTKMLKVEMAKWPSLLSYCERVQSRPAVQAAMKAEGIL